MPPLAALSAALLAVPWALKLAVARGQSWVRVSVGRRARRFRPGITVSRAATTVAMMIVAMIMVTTTIAAIMTTTTIITASRAASARRVRPRKVAADCAYAGH